jgi:hypothetical protein
MSGLVAASSPDRSIFAWADPDGTLVQIKVVRIDMSLTLAETARRVLLIARRAQFQAWFLAGEAFRQKYGVFDPERKIYVLKDERWLDLFRTSMYPERAEIAAMDEQIHMVFSGQSTLAR